MSTIHSLKDALHSRIQMLEAAEDSMTRKGGVIHGVRGERYERGVIEGRLEEARVMFRLVDEVAQSQVTLAQERKDHPLLYLAADEIEPEDMEKWGEQQRGDWPVSTFGGSDFTEAEPDTDRHDPGRC